MSVYIGAKQKLYNLLQLIKNILEDIEEYDIVDRFQSDLDYTAPELIEEKWESTRLLLEDIIPIDHPMRLQMQIIWQQYTRFCMLKQD